MGTTSRTTTTRSNRRSAVLNEVPNTITTPLLLCSSSQATLLTANIDIVNGGRS